jgi:serine/threonine-protein kinase SRPK3
VLTGNNLLFSNNISLSQYNTYCLLTDLQEKNIILGLNDESVLEEFENEERINPSPRKSVGDAIIYQTREIGTTEDPGRPIIADFGEARFGQATYDDDIQPYQYRAPEVILDIPWRYEVDVWNVGVMVRAP